MPENEGTDKETTEVETTTTAVPEKKFTQDEFDKMLSDRLARERSKYSDYADLKKFRASAMSEQEKAIAEAEQRGRSSALTAVGSRLAKAEFATAAAGKVSSSMLEGFLEYADLKKFVGDDGEPDVKAIQAAVKKLAGSGAGATDYDGGARSPADRPKDMNALIRQQAGFA